MNKHLPINTESLVVDIASIVLPHIEWFDTDIHIPLMQGSSVTIKELDGVEYNG